MKGKKKSETDSRRKRRADMREGGGKGRDISFSLTALYLPMTEKNLPKTFSNYIFIYI